MTMFWNENRTTELLFNFLGEKIKNKKTLEIERKQIFKLEIII